MSSKEASCVGTRKSAREHGKGKKSTNGIDGKRLWSGGSGRSAGEVDEVEIERSSGIVYR
jgi:hypothetical protein